MIIDLISKMFLLFLKALMVQHSCWLHNSVTDRGFYTLTDNHNYVFLQSIRVYDKDVPPVHYL